MKLDLNYGASMTSKTAWLVIVLFILITVTNPVRMLLIRTNESRSSTISTTEDHVLTGYVIHQQRTTDILTCAHLCLARPSCMSFNFHNTRNGICQLNRKVFNGTKIMDKSALSAKRGYSFSQLVNISAELFPNSGKHEDDDFVFTALGARGETGPTNTSGYVGTSLEGKVTLDNGIQIWAVPVTGIYVIEVSGASGANGTDANDPVSWRIGGLGAKIKGTFKLHKGTQLKILVGQEGDRTTSFADRPGGGGGGSFVTSSDNTPLIIAGGGGGGGTAREQFKDGDPGQATENGTRCGGTGGTGGQFCNADTGNVDSSLIVGGGAGLLRDGGGRPGIAKMSSSFINGGTGGTCPASKGGFGGGGFGFVLGGGGGGYSGGGVVGTTISGVAGGGGSFNCGKNQHNETGVNEGDGKVIIKVKTK